MDWAIGLILVCVGLGVAGELLFKTGVGQGGGLDLASGAGNILASILTNPLILAGFVCYGIGAILWVVVLSRLDLSYAYPMYALMYAFIPIAAMVFLHEQIPAGRWLGILMIVAGVMIVFQMGGTPQA